MTPTTIPGRLASRLERFAAGLCLTLIAYAFMMAGQAHAGTIQDTAASPAPPAAAAASYAPGDGPALWVVRDEDSTVYLFGTVHLLKPGTVWRSAKVDTALDRASEVWFEVTDPDNHAALTPIIQQYGLSPDQKLSSLLNTEEQAELDTAARSMGTTAAGMDSMRPWFAALMIGMTPLTQAGYDASAGVELDLRARALAQGKTIMGFETLDQQISGLAQMSEEGQLTYLRHYLTSRETAAPDFDRTVAGWLIGDEQAIADFSRANGRDISEETHQLFMARRNADWTRQIQTLMQGSGTAFIAVGAAHLGGEDSVIDMLKAQGLEVRRD